jgi:hypothetical protein
MQTTTARELPHSLDQIEFGTVRGEGSPEQDGERAFPATVGGVGRGDKGRFR